MATNHPPPEKPHPTGPQQPDGGPDPDSELPGWARLRPRRRITSRRNLLLVIVGIVVLGFLIWLNFPFIPDPVILLSRQPTTDYSSSSVGDQWTMAGRTSGHTRYAADPIATPEGVAAWSADAGPATSASPVVFQGRVFLPAHFRIAVLDVNTGEELDSIPESGPMHNSIAVAGDRLYYGTIDGRLVARNSVSHETVWEYPLGDSAAGPVMVDGGIVYAGALDGSTYAIDAASGERIWQHEALSEVRSPAALLNNWAYVASADRSLYALDARTGQERVRFRTSAQLVAAPVVANGLVYFVSGGDLFAMDADALEIPGRYALTRTWSQLWLWGFPLPQPPSQPGDRWRYTPGPEPVQGIISAPAVTQDALFVGDLLGNLHALDPFTGVPIWTFAEEGAIVASPVVTGDLLAFADNAGMVYGLDRANGAERWRLQLPAPVRTDPVFAGGLLLVRTADGVLHAIQ